MADKEEMKSEANQRSLHTARKLAAGEPQRSGFGMNDKNRVMIQVVIMAIFAILSCGCMGFQKPCLFCQADQQSYHIPGRHVDPGMTKKEVVAVLGSPASVEQECGCQVMKFISDKKTREGPGWAETSWIEYRVHFNRKGILTRVYRSDHECESGYGVWDN